MSQITQNSLSAPAFFALIAGRDRRWELVDGQPVMMAPTTQRHADIVANTLAALHHQLRGTGCRPTCSRTGVRTGEATIRYPDIVVDCGARDDHGMCATSPVLLCELLSPARDLFDTHQRVSEYRAVQDIACIVLIDPEAPRAIIHRRDGAGWRDHLHAGLDQIVDISELGATLVLRDVYDGCGFDHPDDTRRGCPC
jgi:Uma2 family endonuclease